METSIETYENDALRTIGPHNDFLYLTIGLVGEIGEVIDYAKKTLYHGHKYEEDKFVEELGDSLWYIAAICHNRGIPFVDVIDDSVNLVPSSQIVLDPNKIFGLSGLANSNSIHSDLDSSQLCSLMKHLVREIHEIALMAHLELTDILSYNIKKLKKRYPRGYSSKQSIERFDHGR